VQYIPLLFTVAAEGGWKSPDGFDRLDLAVGKNDPAWREFLRHYYRLILPPLTLASGEILLAAFNMRLIDLKYRGHLVTVRVEPAPKWYQLARMNQNLFYKDRIIFEVFTPDEERQCRQTWDRGPLQTPKSLRTM
jgi:hypothetical protein